MGRGARACVRGAGGRPWRAAGGPGGGGEAMCDAGAFAVSLAWGGAISVFPSSMREESDGVRFRVT